MEKILTIAVIVFFGYFMYIGEGSRAEKYEKEQEKKEKALKICIADNGGVVAGNKQICQCKKNNNCREAIITKIFKSRGTSNSYEIK